MILLLAVSICSMACGPASKNKALSLPIFKEKILTLTDDERYNINIRYQAIANAEELPLYIYVIPHTLPRENTTRDIAPLNMSLIVEHGAKTILSAGWR